MLQCSAVSYQKKTILMKYIGVWGSVFGAVGGGSAIGNAIIYYDTILLLYDTVHSTPRGSTVFKKNCLKFQIAPVGPSLSKGDYTAPIIMTREEERNASNYQLMHHALFQT